MIQHLLGSIAASLLMIFSIQNVAANQPSTEHSFAQFCHDLQAKDDFSGNPEETAKFATRFAKKTQSRLDRHQLNQRGPTTRMQFVFQIDHKMTAKFCTVFVRAFAHNTWRDFVRWTPLSLPVLTGDCIAI